MTEAIAENHVNLSEEYTKIEKTITDQENENQKKKNVLSNTIFGIGIALVTVSMTILVILSIINKADFWETTTLMGLAGLVGVFLVILSSPLNYYISDEYATRLYSAQKEFVENHGLEITDIELSYLNFPQIGAEKKEGFCGAAEVVDKNTRALKKVTLHQNAGELILCDENGTNLTTVN